MNDLVRRLSEQQHPVAVGGSQPTLEDFRQRIEDHGYLLVKFPNTRGGTNIGMRIDKSTTDLSSADFKTGTGLVHVEGTLSLDYVMVRCFADIELPSLTGLGRLGLVESIGNQAGTEQ